MRKYQINDIVDFFDIPMDVIDGTIMYIGDNIYKIIDNGEIYYVDEDDIRQYRIFNIGDHVRVDGIPGFGIITDKRMNNCVFEYEICGKNQYHIWALQPNIYKINPVDSIEMEEITTEEERVPIAWKMTETIVTLSETKPPSKLNCVIIPLYE